jgi:Icc-related predicted phosphoesterase
VTGRIGPSGVEGTASGDIRRTSGDDGRSADRLDGRTVRIAAVGDLHFGEERDAVAALVRRAEEEADVLVLAGDLTTHGQPAQAAVLGDVLGGVSMPVVAVLGNHDYEGGRPAEVRRLLCERGVHVLDGETFEVDGVGFAGVKGFAGGFGRGALASFGEPLIKSFVQEAVDEAMKLENALRTLATPVRVALLHYAPIVGTLDGEPEIIFPFLGSSRLLPPIDTIGADVVFHGHAHTGRLEAHTPAGVPVYNVALPVLAGLDPPRPFHVWDARVPDQSPPAPSRPDANSAAARSTSGSSRTSE